MKPQVFARIAESLRQYRRAELKDFEIELGAAPIDKLYVDPLPGDAVLNSVLSGNTTFLLGRKGTGKSTVFAKGQNEIRKRKDIISIYIDVKSLYDIITSTDIASITTDTFEINEGILRSHILRKTLLGAILADLLKEIDQTCESLSIWDVWLGRRKSYIELQHKLRELQVNVRKSTLQNLEIPILQKITKHWKSRQQQEVSQRTDIKAGVKLSTTKAQLETEASLSDFDKSLDDMEIYNEYSDIILRSFPFNEIISEIKDLLQESGLARLVVFFDDFSELNFIDQRLFVDVILAPLNNSSNELIKLKIAGYPGRVYYGKIDPTKVDTISLDFSSIFEASEVQTMEQSAIEYTTRLLKTRFESFGENIEEYFDSSISFDQHMRLVFETTFNVPRLMGALLHYCYFDKVSNGQQITPAALKLASQKYYQATISQYFDRMTRFALEPFENKLDRHNQYELLKCLIAESRRVRKGVIDGSVGGTYFRELRNPPVSHFIVSPKLEKVFKSLESNFFLTKYKNTRDKNANDVCVYAFYYGLTESERMAWGYPAGREYRNYFVQRCFDYTRVVHEFLSHNQTIRCNQCGKSYPLEQQGGFELFKWRCPECNEGICSIVNLSEDFEKEVAQLEEDIMLEEVELNILNAINEEDRKMRAGEISTLIDVTYQLVGKRTSKLQDMGLVTKEREPSDNKMRSEITKRAKETYFQ
jgi:DNA-binding transcriptional ArsR family regulator